jgi:hypothetical protein
MLRQSSPTQRRGSMADTLPLRRDCGPQKRAHTENMAVFSRAGLNLACAILALTIALASAPAWADEIRLKDGKKLYGVIVAYEENMFKVKTEFGYVLVEKDKIASIVPTTPPTTPETPTPAKDKGESPKAEPPKPAPTPQPKTESAVAVNSETAPAATTTSAKTVIPSTPSGAGKPDKAAKLNAASAKPETPAKAASTNAAAPAKGNSPVANPAAVTTAPAQTATTQTVAPAPAKPPEPPPIQEEVQGNIYINHTHGFRMYKAPSWQVIDDARNALPNAIVAMGTSDESSLMVVGKETTKQSLEAAAVTVEKRLREVYANYQQTSRRKTVVSGLPAVEFRYIGKADEHDWSGILVVIGRGSDIFTVLGMTYADSDLIQIQENVIAKSIASLNFDVH